MIFEILLGISYNNFRFFGYQLISLGLPPPPLEFPPPPFFFPVSSFCPAPRSSFPPLFFLRLFKNGGGGVKDFSKIPQNFRLLRLYLISILSILISAPQAKDFEVFTYSVSFFIKEINVFEGIIPKIVHPRRVIPFYNKYKTMLENVPQTP